MTRVKKYETGSYQYKRNPWRPELVALDIDGTLVDHDGILPDAVKDAVQRVVAADVPVVLVTGRSWHDTQPIFEALELPPGAAIASNGAVSVQYPPLRIQQQHTFDPSGVIAKLHAAAPHALIAVEEVGVGYRCNALFPDGDLSGEIHVVGMDELVSRPVTRVIIRDPNSTDQEFMRLAEEVGLHGVSYFVGWTAWLDIAPEGVNKAAALDDLCRSLGVDPARVLALGDGRNDIEMLQWAGRGVAIGDAPPEVQAAADDVTGCFAAGGTADELNRWFPAVRWRRSRERLLAS